MHNYDEKVTSERLNSFFTQFKLIYGNDVSEEFVQSIIEAQIAKSMENFISGYLCDVSPQTLMLTLKVLKERNKNEKATSGRKYKSNRKE